MNNSTELAVSLCRRRVVNSCPEEVDAIERQQVAWGGGGEEGTRAQRSELKDFSVCNYTYSNWHLGNLILQQALHYTGYKLTDGDTHSRDGVTDMHQRKNLVRSIAHDISKVMLNAFCLHRVLTYVSFSQRK